MASSGGRVGRGREAQRVVAGHALAREDRLDLGQQREQLVARGRPALLGDAEPVERPDADERLGGGPISARVRRRKSARSRKGRTARSRSISPSSRAVIRCTSRKPTRIARAVALDGVARLRLVDVRRQDLDAVTPRVVDHEPRRVEAHRLVVEDRGGELGRVVGPQPRARVAHHGEARRVRLVEAVGREPLELPEDLVGDLVLDAARERRARGSAPRMRSISSRLRPLVIARRKRVGLGEVEAGDRARDEQHLLLVDDDAVGVGEHLAHALVRHARPARGRAGGG